MKLLRYTVYTLLSLVAALSLLLGVFGVSSVLLTLTVYILLIAGSRKLCFVFIRHKPQAVNVALFVAVFWGSMLAGELALRYVFKIALEKQELDGGFFYSLPYGPDIINRLARTYVLKNDDPTLNNRMAYSHEQVGNGEFSYSHQYNELGLRGGNCYADTACVNVVVLGDSYTEGMGAPEDSTWCALTGDMMCCRAAEKKAGGLHGSLSMEAL